MSLFWSFNDPGCSTVDIPGAAHSLSFAPNPDFSEWFPSQPEILAYLAGVSEKHDVDKHVVGNTEWQGKRWQVSTHTWQVQLKDLRTGESFMRDCRILISAVGGLANPQPLRLPGSTT